MAVTCGVCGEICIEDKSSIKCNGYCELTFHTKCVFKFDGVKTRTSSKDWKCDKCIVKKGSSISSKSSTDSTAITKSFFVSIIEDLKKQVSVDSSKIASQLQEFKNSVESQLQEFKKSVEFVSSSLDSVNNLITKVKDEMNEMKRNNVILNRQNVELKEEVVELRSRVRALEQYSRKTNVEISGIPESPQEDVISILKDVGAAIGQELQEAQVVAAHRVPSYKKERIPSLVVRFQTQMLKDKWISSYKKKGALIAKEVNSAFSNNRVYINEHLSPDNKLFLSQLKKKCSEMNVKYAWYKEGKFFVRKGDGEKCFRVNNIEDLVKFFK